MWGWEAISRENEHKITLTTTVIWLRMSSQHWGLELSDAVWKVLLGLSAYVLEKRVHSFRSSQESATQQDGVVDLFIEL